MGNSQSNVLRTAITSNDLGTLRRLLDHPQAASYLNRPLNRKCDTPLILACRLGHLNIAQQLLQAGCDVNLENRHQDTALDVALNRMLPSDGDILNHHGFSVHISEQKPLELDTIVMLLLSAHAHGQSLERLVLHHMRSAHSVKTIIHALVDVAHPDLFRISGLLIQVCVWFNQINNLMTLFCRGVMLENFWLAAFMPRIQPPSSPRAELWPREEASEYTVVSPPDSNAIQSLKFSFIQDWRVDWNDGENPEAQFRAGLHLTPEGALLFVRAANNYDVLLRVMGDVLLYLPAVCRGPDLKENILIELLMLAGYVFSEDEIRHLSLKFQLDFAQYRKFHAQPKQLKQLCRVSVRNSVRHNVYWATSRMDTLPRPITSFLLLHDCQ